MKVEMSDGRGRVSKVIISLIHHLSLLSTNTPSSLTYSCQLSRHQVSWLSHSWSIGLGSRGVSDIIITPSNDHSPSLLPCFPSVVGITAAAIESSIDPTDQWRHHHPTLLQSLFMLPTRSLHSIDGVSRWHPRSSSTWSSFHRFTLRIASTTSVLHLETDLYFDYIENRAMSKHHSSQFHRFPILHVEYTSKMHARYGNGHITQTTSCEQLTRNTGYMSRK